MASSPKGIYTRLKTKMKNAYYTDHMVNNLENFRVEASVFLSGPGEYEDLSFLKICANLEGNGNIGWNKLENLKTLVQSATGGKEQLLDMINDAKREIQLSLSGNDVQLRRNTVQPEPQAATSGGAGNFHKTKNATLSFAMIQAMGKSDLNKSVGIIKIKINDQLESGTGFRFEENYVMTAYHVFEGIVKHVWKLVMAIVEQSDKKEAIYQKISTMFSRSSADIDPKRQALPFGHLFEYLHTMGLPIEVFEEKWKDAVNIEFGVREGKTTAGEFNFEYNIPFADSDHDVVVLQISKGSKGLPPPLTLAKYMVADKVHLFGYPIGSTEIDLSSDIECPIYADNRELTGDVTKAIEWWRKEKRRPVKNEYAVCHYINDNHTDTGKIFLHTSKQFERGSSGCPAFTFINEQPVVQLMYLRGYPEFCYKEGTFPPPQYLFEAGVSMPVVTRLLQECCRQIMA